MNEAIHRASPVHGKKELSQLCLRQLCLRHSCLSLPVPLQEEWHWQAETTMPAPRHSVFYRPDALPDAQPTVSKH